MSDVRAWFESELQRLGFAGLEGVYDYLSTMSESESLEYLRSLLGSDPAIQRFASAYVTNRASGNTNPSRASASATPSSNRSLTTWATSGASSSMATSKKSKKARGKGRNGTSSKTGGSKKEEKPSFASAVTHEKTSLARSEQMQAIRNSPVELARQKVREYREQRRPVNCIKCGKIEMLVREDGACSFCGAALFAIWERKEKRGAVPVPVVLGRYTFPGKGGGGGLEGRLRDIEGNFFGGEGMEVSEDGSRKKGGSGIYRNPVIDEKGLEALCRSAEESLRKMSERGSSARDGDDWGGYGRLQIDDLAPSVYVNTE